MGGWSGVLRSSPFVTRFVTVTVLLLLPLPLIARVVHGEALLLLPLLRCGQQCRQLLDEAAGLRGIATTAVDGLLLIIVIYGPIVVSAVCFV